ncbi:MAG TPA: hypothetical protein VLF59_01945 [Candidatus Saccharimonadales bacterium]|nr:hypothetical protein [Candidatus Saccharimonadales bacterium]
MSISQNTRNILDAAIVIAAGGLIISAYLQTKRMGRAIPHKTKATGQEAPDASAIIDFYTAGHNLINAGTGIVDGMRYSMYLTMPAEKQYGEAYVPGSAVIYVLDLPFNTQAHLLGLSRLYQLNRLQFESFITSNGLSKTDLEGDFPDHFDVYTGPDQGFRIRSVLKPDATQFVERYCSTHFWELHDSELYFVVTEHAIGDVNFITESQQFVDAIRPTLAPGDPNAPIVHHEVPYDIYDGPPLNCPVCQREMELHDGCWFMCAQGHGALMTGRELGRLEKQLLMITIDSAHAVHHGPLICPHCAKLMELVHYQGGPIEIDSCTNCPFRWLDANEIGSIAGRRLASSTATY